MYFMSEVSFHLFSCSINVCVCVTAELSPDTRASALATIITNITKNVKIKTLLLQLKPQCKFSHY